MRPYKSLFFEDDNCGRENSKPLKRRESHSVSRKNVIPIKYRRRLKETVEEKSTSNKAQPVFIINILSGDNVTEVIQSIFNCLKNNMI